MKTCLKIHSFHFDDFSVSSQPPANFCIPQRGFGPLDFQHKVVLDLGAGSKLRSKHFQNAILIAVEPLAKRFMDEIPWCDLRDARMVYECPVEEFIPELECKADFIMCINVLDHVYDPGSFLKNAWYYLKPEGQFLLSLDLHEHVDEKHPVALNAESLRTLVENFGFSLKHLFVGLEAIGVPSYGQGIAYTLILMKAHG